MLFTVFFTELSSKNTVLLNTPQSTAADWRSASCDLRDREIFGFFSSSFLQRSSPWLFQGLLCLYGGVSLLAYRRSCLLVDNASAAKAMPPNPSAPLPRCPLLSLPGSDRPFSQIRIANSSRRASADRHCLLQLKLFQEKVPRWPSQASPRSVTRLSRTGFWVAL